MGWKEEKKKMKDDSCMLGRHCRLPDKDERGLYHIPAPRGNKEAGANNVSRLVTRASTSGLERMKLSYMVPLSQRKKKSTWIRCP